MTLETRKDYGDMADEKKPKGPPPPPAMLGLPARLDRAMDARGVNQVELAEASGVSQPVISTLLAGDNLHGVTGVVLARICLALRIPPGWLLIGEGDVIPSLRPGSDGVVRIDEAQHPLVPEMHVRPAPRKRRARRA